MRNWCPWPTPAVTAAVAVRVSPIAFALTCAIELPAYLRRLRVTRLVPAPRVL